MDQRPLYKSSTWCTPSWDAWHISTILQLRNWQVLRVRDVGLFHNTDTRRAVTMSGLMDIACKGIVYIRVAKRKTSLLRSHCNISGKHVLKKERGSFRTHSVRTYKWHDKMLCMSRHSVLFWRQNMEEK